MTRNIHQHARRREQAGTVIDDDGVVGAMPHRADIAGEILAATAACAAAANSGRRPRPGRRTRAPGMCAASYSAARIALLRRQIPGARRQSTGPARRAAPAASPASTMKGLSSAIRCSPAALAVTSFRLAGIGPKRMRKRRFSRPFFSILPMWISPTSPVARTWVPPQGWLSTAALSPMQTSRIRPVPTGGRTFFDLTRPGLAASSSSVIQLRDRPDGRRRPAPSAARVTSSLVKPASGMSKSTRLFVLADRRAGDRKRADDGQQMAGGVHAHQPVAALPVDRASASFSPIAGTAWPGSRDMDDLVLGLAGDASRRSSIAAAIGALEKAGIAGLAARRRIEDRSGRARCRHAR